jgi:hypothetical protein
MPQLPRPDLRSPVLLSLAGALVALVGPGAPPAMAQDGGTGGGSNLLGGSKIAMRLELPKNDGEDFQIETNEQVILDFMNLGNCSCGDAVKFQVETKLDPPVSSADGANEPVDIWTGTGCAVKDTDQRDNQCIQITDDGIGQVDDLFTTVQHPQISVRNLVGPSDLGAACKRSDDEDRLIYSIVDVSSDGFDDGTDYQNSLSVLTDTQPPPEPLDISPRGSEGRVVVDFTPPTSRKDDIRFYQLLCARVDDPTNKTGFGTHDPEYWTSQQACGSDADGVCPRAPGSAERIVGGPDGGLDAGSGSDAGAGEDGGSGGGGGNAPEAPCVTGLPGGLDTLDPSYLCGQAEGTGSSVSAEGLENGVAYHLVLLVIDEARNVTAIDAGEATPKPVKDFWEDYKDQGGQARGGCSAGQAGLGGGLVIACGLALAVFRRRRRNGRGHRRGRGGPGAAAGGALLLALVLGHRPAAAQPWWEDYNEPVQTQVGPAQPHWGLELKLGPYFPDVDGEFNLGSGEKGPFETMYGDGPFLMSLVTLDRYLFHPLGQLGVSVTAGFMTRSANAFEVDADGNVVIDEDNGRPERSVGDTTTFRLFPMSLGIVYRYTQLDDVFRIPVVPYGRLGLSYYYWWITKPGGGVAEVPTDGCPDLENGDCDGDSGRGGSLGWQATAGLAIRAERVDPQAESALRNELGIEHAGLVFEFTYAKVDGFGSSHKLAVGDGTFFGGINFEF